MNIYVFFSLKMQMLNQLKNCLKTPEEARYLAKVTKHDHFDDLSDIDNALASVPEKLQAEERRRYTESCFGHFLQMQRNMKFSGGILHRLLIRELHHEGPVDEMRFLLGPHSVRFSKVEFSLITGLKFGDIPNTSTYDMIENGLHQRYFDGRDEIENLQLKRTLRNGGFTNQYDAVKMCLLYMLNWILTGEDERDKVPLWQFRLVEDLDAFDAFPWGAYLYKLSIYHFKQALVGRSQRFVQHRRTKGEAVHRQESYNVYGLTHALLVRIMNVMSYCICNFFRMTYLLDSYRTYLFTQIFAFEVILQLADSNCGTRREIDLSPRILKWELNQRPRGDKLDEIFTDDVSIFIVNV